MNDPGRLLEESDNELERVLLRAGASHRSSNEARSKTLAALGLTGSAAIAAGAFGAASALSKFTWTKLVVAISALGAVAAVPVGYYAWHLRHAPAVAPAARPTLVVAEPAAPEPTTTTTTATTTIAARPAAAGDARAAPVAARGARPSRTEPRNPRTAATLTQELGALDAARARLAEGNAVGALALLDGYARKYPRGGLELEAEVLRIDALARSGRADAAHRRAELFLRRHPNSVLASRARRYLDD
jgi:hypothetical protein